MHIRTVVVDSYDDMGRLIAGRIAALIRERAAAGRTAVLGLASGSTPIPVYRELIRMHREDGLSFANVISFNLDEYFALPPDSIHSYSRYMWENFFSFIDIDPANVHIPRGDVTRDRLPAEVKRYEELIRDAGGIDIQLLGIGKTGHIGFNEPGSGIDSRTRLVTLDMVTRKDAAADFFGEENVPREAISMGVGTILEAREILILATGEHKADIVRRAVEGEIDLEVPATFLQKHENTTFYLDRAAAADLTPIATPWLLDEVEWTNELAIRAVTWLAKRCGRGILKLTQKDYAEHRLSSLVALHGSPGALNGMVFNALGAKIRGRSKLPRDKRIVCFSPHPDDDVISMGGILHKLIENGNEITVAYMTSGNIALFDHDVRRHMDFLRRMAAEGYASAEMTEAVSRKVTDSLARKRPGDVDIPEVLDIKRVIRESEAISGIAVLGLSAHAGRFLNLPFYQTGMIRKDPVGPADVAIVRALLEETRPDLVFVAGDLSDPHGTHRMCKEAIDRALAELWGGGARSTGGSASAQNEAQTSARREEQASALSADAHNSTQTSGPREEQAAAPSADAHERTQTSGRFSRPEVWLYRGAWQEWPVTDATWLVPLSQEELRLKIQAIFKHQSQKDTAPFPGQDDREFWQRVEARNKGTAAELDDLGLAEYFAMEAYVVD